jgi:hypothetical protein
MTTVPGALTTPSVHDRPGTRSTTTTDTEEHTMTTRYRHVPEHYRRGTTDLAASLAAIADLLDGSHPHDLALRLDDLTDVVLVAERMAAAIVARYGSAVTA